MAKVGTVKFFNDDKGYGFIQPDDGSSDSFVHISAVQAAGMHTLTKDQRVNFEAPSTCRLRDLLRGPCPRGSRPVATPPRPFANPPRKERA